MKINIEIDITPEEARELAGLPNLSSLHTSFLNTAMGNMEKSAADFDIDPLVKTWTGIGNIANEAFKESLNSIINASKTSDKK